MAFFHIFVLSSKFWFWSIWELWSSAAPYIADLVAITADAGYVTMAFRREMDNPNADGTYTTTWFDMFRVEDGMIAEHWDYGTISAR